MDISEQLIYGTTRIECRSSNRVGTGTGFFHLCARRGDMVSLVIVTNRHVLEGFEEATVQINTEHDGKVDVGQHVNIRIPNLQSIVTYHPDPNIDLAMLPLAPIFNVVQSLGKSPHVRHSDDSFIARDELLEDLRPCENIIMIGYPNGLWDSTNNLPLIRTGVTSTPLETDFQGRPEFVIDCACFPGSSGSPVILYQSGFYYSKKNRSMNAGQRAALLGILYAGPQHNAEGDIVVKTIPTQNVPGSLTRIPNNLGYCIKARELDAFKEIVEKLLDAEQQIQPIVG